MKERAGGRPRRTVEHCGVTEIFRPRNIEQTLHRMAANVDVLADIEALSAMSKDLYGPDADEDDEAAQRRHVVMQMAEAREDHARQEKAKAAAIREAKFQEWLLRFGTISASQKGCSPRSARQSLRHVEGSHDIFAALPALERAVRRSEAARVGTGAFRQTSPRNRPAHHMVHSHLSTRPNVKLLDPGRYARAVVADGQALIGPSWTFPHEQRACVCACSKPHVNTQTLQDLCQSTTSSFPVPGSCGWTFPRAERPCLACLRSGSDKEKTKRSETAVHSESSMPEECVPFW
jgi:hypothetical protein